MPFGHHAKEVLQHVAVNGLLHRWDEVEREVVRTHPCHLGELAAAVMRRNSGFRTLFQVAEEVSLFLSVKAAAIRSRWEVVTVACAFRRDAVGLRCEGYFLGDLAFQGVLGMFVRVHSSLRKLPALRVIGAPCNQDATIPPPDDCGDVGAIALGHGDMVCEGVRRGK